MKRKMKTQIIVCPNRKRPVEVTYSNSGNWFFPRYEIEDCPAIYDGPASCNRQCREMFNRPPNYLSLGRNSDRM